MIDRIYGSCSSQLQLHRIYKRDHSQSASFISPHNMLILTLYWLRLYPTYDHMAEEFAIPSSTLERLLRHVIEILNTTIVPVLIVPLSATDPASSFSQHSDVYIIIDSTFIAIPRPMYKEERKYNYHFKSPTKFALKVQVCCNVNNMIIDVSDVVDGSTADIKLVDGSNVLHQLRPNQLAIGDSGYTGKENIRVPLKRNSKVRQQQRLKPNITRLQREQKRELQRQRSVIENINQRLKQWHILGTIYRGQRDDYTYITMIIHVVCALCNLYMSRFPVRKK